MKRARGFTMIELMIVVGIVALLAAIAYPLYTSQIRKSRRSEARQVLADMSLKEEKWRVDHALYGTSVLLGGFPNASYYNFTITNNTAVGYTITGAPKGDQTKDTTCGSLVLTMASGTVTKSASSGSTDCW